jgi:uncharacterized protein YihD (DUF1040 family)
MPRCSRRVHDTLTAVEIFWKKHPGWRLGQILENVARFGCNRAEVFYLEDEMLIRGLQVLTKRIQEEADQGGSGFIAGDPIVPEIKGEYVMSGGESALDHLTFS